ncbi:AAA family ATPase [Corynebacterium sp. zg912]|uniref:AAA family ATPase n=1 Tax=Corynebacterium wankanglinii TaxID=2735136 RepID=A0A7H0KBU6_9CORY|nr:MULTISPECIES: ATP-binding protein [Corynebacterium]MBA1837520.1 AAA family ATPase [Corynebacterium wankanglinii]MCR5928644.1 AAA family ATPase [Corynebacterium sp. zg912]QNP94762.1 AAA family ATPase [Corynebacterium wankanglinii]
MTEIASETGDGKPFKIDAVRIRNFKKLKDARIELGPITYLVGGNNSGKSSVLQAIHTAVSCAQTSLDLGEKVVAETSLRYSPVADFALLGHGRPYENRSGGQRGVVDFEGCALGSADPADYHIEMYKARNHGNVGVNRTGITPGFGQLISDPQKLFSVYVPGLAGVPHREEMSGYAAVFRKAASGDANLVFRNIIRLIDHRDQLQELERLVGDVLSMPVKFDVRFNAERDLYVNVRMAISENPSELDYLPVDLWGTGILQVTQIFAYVLLFSPKLLLVDEPDSHLHPSRQHSLGSALEKVSDHFGCKVVVSTHSRHLLTGASENVRVVWMKDGRVESTDQRELTELLLDLGALDQLDNSTKCIIYTEDGNPSLLQRTLDSLGYEQNEVRIATFNGINNSFAAQAFHDMVELLDSAPRVIIHRDRDFLTSEELAKWSHPFEEKGVEVFCPKLCDVEAYYCTAEHIAEAAGISLDQATRVRSAVIQDHNAELRKKFRNKRANVNKTYLDGGSPRTEDLWPENTSPKDDAIYGKDLLKWVTEELNKQELKSQLINKPSKSLAAELRNVLQSDGTGVEFRFNVT